MLYTTFLNSNHVKTFRIKSHFQQTYDPRTVRQNSTVVSGGSVDHFAKVPASRRHASLSLARAIQVPSPVAAQYLLHVSSHFIHLRVEGRRGRTPPDSMAHAFHSESRHVVTLHAHVVPGIRATGLAHDHFACACAYDQFRTLQALASATTFRVTRLIQSIHSSHFFHTISK